MKNVKRTYEKKVLGKDRTLIYNTETNTLSVEIPIDNLYRTLSAEDVDRILTYIWNLGKDPEGESGWTYFNGSVIDDEVEDEVEADTQDGFVKATSWPEYIEDFDILPTEKGILLSISFYDTPVFNTDEEVMKNRDILIRSIEKFLSMFMDGLKYTRFVINPPMTADEFVRSLDKSLFLRDEYDSEDIDEPIEEHNKKADVPSGVGLF